MMPNFNEQSKTKLAQCDQMLQLLFNEVIKTFDCTVIEGHRGKEKQDKAFAEGKSDKRWPYGMHNSMPSKAVDIAPFPINWNDKMRFYHFAGYVKGIASRIGVNIRWGGDWDGDTDLNDQNLFDLVHFELERK